MHALPLLSLLALHALPASLTLEEALELSHQHQPDLAQANAQAQAADARARQALSAMLPTVALGLAYQRSTANFIPQPGQVPSSLSSSSSAVSLNAYDYWSGNVRVAATLWDFGQLWNRYQASLSSAQAQEASERGVRRTSDAAVRTLFAAAASQQALVRVAEEALANTQAHLAQVEGVVKVGTRPEIDLAQAQADVAQARLSLLQAKNGAAVARAQVTDALGVAAAPTWDVTGPEQGDVPGEQDGLEALLPAALAARPEVVGLAAQVKAQDLTIRATRGAYLPTLGVALTGTLASRSLPTFVPNLNGQLTLNWPLFEGGVTRAREAEGEATLRALQAQRDGATLQVRLELQQALLNLETAKETVSVSGEGARAAHEKLRLAQGRYQAGAGSALELSDAQAAATKAEGQQVQARFSVSSARAALLAALGR